MLEDFFEDYGDYFYVVMRVVIGILFGMHGLAKLTGWFGPGQATDVLFIVVGVGELLIGLAVLVGVFTRLAALGGAITMIVGYVWMHAPSGLLPMENGGELALLYLVAFVAMIGYGARKLSLENAILKREIF